MEKKKYACNTRAKNKWNAENYDRLYPYVKIGKKAIYQKAVEAGGFESLNDLIETATDRIAAEVLGLTPEQYAAEVQAPPFCFIRSMPRAGKSRRRFPVYCRNQNFQN